MNARLVRYAPFQLRDFLTQRLVLALVMIGLFGGLPTYMMVRNTPPGFMQTPQGVALAKQMFSNFITLFLPLGAFLGGVGMITADRQQGYYRFLFSKPVNVVGYYAQAYLIHIAVFVVTFGAIVWAYGAYTVHFPVLGSMEAAALSFLLIGGIGLLLGALVRPDGLVLIVVYVVSLILQQLLISPGGLRNGGLPQWLVWIAKGLPPVGKLDRVRDQFYAAQMPDWVQFWHVAGYGAVAALLGLVMLRRMPLAR